MSVPDKDLILLNVCAPFCVSNPNAYFVYVFLKHYMSSCVILNIGFFFYIFLCFYESCLCVSVCVCFLCKLVYITAVSFRSSHRLSVPIVGIFTEVNYYGSDSSESDLTLAMASLGCQFRALNSSTSFTMKTIRRLRSTSYCPPVDVLVAPVWAAEV